MFRVIGILVAIAVSIALEYWFGAPWYISLPSGALAYLLARYVGWVVAARGRLKLEMDEIIKKVQRGEPID